MPNTKFVKSEQFIKGEKFEKDLFKYLTSNKSVSSNGNQLKYIPVPIKYGKHYPHIPIHIYNTNGDVIATEYPVVQGRREVKKYGDKSVGHVDIMQLEKDASGKTLRLQYFECKCYDQAFKYKYQYIIPTQEHKANSGEFDEEGFANIEVGRTFYEGNSKAFRRNSWALNTKASFFFFLLTDNEVLAIPVKTLQKYLLSKPHTEKRNMYFWNGELVEGMHKYIQFDEEWGLTQHQAEVDTSLDNQTVPHNIKVGVSVLRSMAIDSFKLP